MHILIIQVLSLTGLFVSMITIFLLPCWWASRQPYSFEGNLYQLSISLANCLSGGVFIATFFVGLMPEIHLLLEAYEHKLKFPLSEFIVFLGFLLTLAIEQYILQRRENSTQYTSLPLETDDNDKIKLNSDSKCSHSYDSDSNSKPASILYKDDIQNENHAHSNHSHTDMSNYLTQESRIRLGMLVISLGVHSIFEGLALGLQTDVSLLINLIIGVALHELLVAFAMGVSVSRQKLPESTTFKLALIFSASIPLGQVLGLLIGHYHSTTTAVISGILQGLAAGTFIHVTFFEIIPSEFHERGYRILKVFFVGLGFILFLVCTVTIKNVFSSIH